MSIWAQSRFVSLLVSLHIRSLWETICDAWACWSGWKFGPNSTEYPYSEIQFQNTPPPPKMKIVRDLGTLTFQFQNTPPLKMKIVRDLGTLTFQFQNTPPPQNWNLGRSWHFDFSVSEYPPPQNWNLGRSWHFKTFQFQNYVWQVTTCGDFIQPG